MTNTTFIAVYRGPTAAEARLLAVSADERLVQDVLARLLREPPEGNADPAVRALDEGRRRALRAVVSMGKKETVSAGTDTVEKEERDGSARLQP